MCASPRKCRKFTSTIATCFLARFYLSASPSLAFRHVISWRERKSRVLIKKLYVPLDREIYFYFFWGELWRVINKFIDHQRREQMKRQMQLDSRWDKRSKRNTGNFSLDTNWIERIINSLVRREGDPDKKRRHKITDHSSERACVWCDEKEWSFLSLPEDWCRRMRGIEKMSRKTTRIPLNIAR